MTEWQIGLIVTIIFGLIKIVHNYLKDSKESRAKIHGRIDQNEDRLDDVEDEVKEHLIIHRERDKQ